jgi:hypothetical protein
VILLKSKIYKIQFKFVKSIFSFYYNIRLPTLVFSECVLTYIDAIQVDSVISFFSNNFSNICFATYEMFKPNDSFGKMMVKNFLVKL